VVLHIMLYTAKRRWSHMETFIGGN